MRIGFALGLAVGFSLLTGSVASAAPRGEETEQAEGKGGGKKKKDKGIESTGIASFDRVFEKVGSIDTTLSKVEGSLRSAKLNLSTALALEQGTPLRDALAELQRTAGGKISLVQRGKIPTLSVADGVPSNVRTAVNAVNDLVGNLSGSMDELVALPGQISGLVKETKDFPSQLRAEFSKDSSGLLALLFKLPKVSSALRHNLAVVTGLPDRTVRVTERSTEILGVVTSSFGSKR